MNKTTIIFGSLLAMTLVGCGDEQQVSSSPATTAQNVTHAEILIPPTATDLTPQAVTEPSQPGLNTRQEPVVFMQPLQGEFIATSPQWQQTSQSDEYWFRATGRELNQGLPLAVSQPGSLIRLVPKTDLSSGFPVVPDAIAPDSISISKPGIKSASTLISSKADADALATAGLTDRSSALQLSSTAPAGTYQLKVSQPLPAEASYLVNVKEKHSPYLLSLSAPAAISNAEETVAVQLNLTGRTVNLSPKAMLRLADGSEHKLDILPRDEGWQIRLPADIHRSGSNAGLNELHLSIATEVDGVPVRRNIKSAYKAYVNSARFTDNANSHWQNHVPDGVSFTLDVASEGRYQLSAIVTGTDHRGKEHLLMRTEAATWLTPDSSVMTLPLDQQRIRASGLQAPFRVRALELKDQGQMALLAYRELALTLQ
ncbi:DUF4785 domain-containing protein [Shewanella sp. GXUN23E]|uniref:DUF4785 domain-containing protein n=1 Tax=Shewanella sp. GXUN23E TaxID=3422498 RepID=UPI003D7ED1C6